MQRLQGDDHLDRRAVRVGDDPLVPGDVVRVDLGDDQGHVGVHPPGARVVDDDGAGLRGDRAELAGDRRRACSRGRCRRPRTPRPRGARSGSVSPAELDRLAGAPLRGQELDRADRELRAPRAAGSSRLPPPRWPRRRRRSSRLGSSLRTGPVADDAESTRRDTLGRIPVRATRFRREDRPRIRGFRPIFHSPRHRAIAWRLSATRVGFITMREEFAGTRSWWPGGVELAGWRVESPRRSARGGVSMPSAGSSSSRPGSARSTARRATPGRHFDGIRTSRSRPTTRGA